APALLVPDRGVPRPAPSPFAGGFALASGLASAGTGTLIDRDSAAVQGAGLPERGNLALPRGHAPRRASTSRGGGRRRYPCAPRVRLFRPDVRTNRASTAAQHQPERDQQQDQKRAQDEAPGHARVSLLEGP